MFSLNKLFTASEQQSHQQKELAARLLHANPELLTQFEEAYQNASIDKEIRNAKDMAVFQKQNASDCSNNDLKNRIVRELLAETRTFHYAGTDAKTQPTMYPALTKDTADPVSAEEIKMLPAEQRPELTGRLMKRDIEDLSYLQLIDTYHRMTTAKTEKERQHLYHSFRQGLDILDVDPVVYEMLSLNPNSMGYWLPNIIHAVEKEHFFRIPATTIAKIPATMLQLTRLDYTDHTRTTLDIVDAWAREAFHLQPDKKYFIKTGTYSSKFDFRNAKITEPSEVRDIGEYLLFIHSQAIAMAQFDLSGKGKPVIYGVSTTNEWVVRDFIEDTADEKFCIYHGLPLHTEYRLFVDFDTDEVIGIHPYWDPTVMKQRFGNEPDKNDPDMVHDFVTFCAQEETLMQRYEANKDTVMQHMQTLIADIPLHGQWSVDIMQNGTDFWLIDMATAETSAYYEETVPKQKRRPMKEKWLPDFSDYN